MDIDMIIITNSDEKTPTDVKYSLESFIERLYKKEFIKNDAGLYYIILQDLLKTSQPFSFIIGLIKKMVDNLIFHKKLKIRHVVKVIEYYSINEKYIELDKYYLKEIYPYLEVNNFVIEGLLSSSFPKLLNYYIGEYCLINDKCSDYPLFEQSYDYTILLKQFEHFIEREYKSQGLIKFLSKIPDEKFDIVFDGNNILLNRCGILVKESYDKLVNLYNSCIDIGIKPLVYIHERNVKDLKKKGINITINYIATPYRYDDDWFSLYYGIKNNCFLISKDIFRNHINILDTMNNSNHLKIYLHNRKLNINEDFTEIIFKRTFLPIIIKENECIYIPSNKGYKRVMF